jgi:hypothetical protein
MIVGYLRFVKGLVFFYTQLYYAGVSGFVMQGGEVRD